jgi:hypothetical protein
MRWKDRELKSFILEEDWIFVTQSVSIFRGPVDNPGPGGNLLASFFMPD